RLKFFDNLVPDRVAALMNTRPDSCAKVLRLTAKYFAHCADSFLDNAFGRPAPSRMKGGNHALLRFDNQNGKASRAEDAGQHSGQTCDGASSAGGLRLLAGIGYHMDDV